MGADCSEPLLKSWADLPSTGLWTDGPAAQDMLVERPMGAPRGPLFALRAAWGPEAVIRFRFPSAWARLTVDATGVGLVVRRGSGDRQTCPGAGKVRTNYRLRALTAALEPVANLFRRIAVPLRPHGEPDQLIGVAVVVGASAARGQEQHHRDDERHAGIAHVVVDAVLDHRQMLLEVVDAGHRPVVVLERRVEARDPLVAPLGVHRLDCGAN